MISNGSFLVPPQNEQVTSSESIVQSPSHNIDHLNLSPGTDTRNLGKVIEKNLSRFSAFFF